MKEIKEMWQPIKSQGKRRNVMIQGSILVLSLLVTSILLLFGLIFLSLTGTNYNTLMVSSDNLKAYWIAYAGINKTLYNLRYDYSQYIFDVKKYDFSEGEYEIAIAGLDTTGVRSILCVSNGIYQNSSYSMIAEVQLDTPTDYLYFFDGNGELGVPEGLSDIEIGGSIHSNAHFRSTTYNNHVWFIKPTNITGPLISTAGLITRGAYYQSYTYIDDRENNIIGVKLGEGSPSFDQNFMYTGTVPDKLLDFTRWGFRVWYRPAGGGQTTGHSVKMTYPDDFSSSAWAENPINSSPSETYPTSNTPAGLLNDGYHGGYRIHIPTIRKVSTGVKYKATEYADLPIKTDTEWENEIRNLYANYIDDRWYIRGKKLTDSHENKYYIVENSQGLRIKEFTNDSYRTKFVIGKGNGSNTQFTIPSYYVSALEKIGKQDGSGSLTTFKYFPSTRRIKNVYFNGLNVNLQPDYTFSADYQYQANVYLANELGVGSWVSGNSKIAFDTAPSDNRKNIKVRFTSGKPFRIGRGDGSTTLFDYYPGTITDVYVDSGSGFVLQSKPANYTDTNADHTETGDNTPQTLTTSDNITYSASEGYFSKFLKSDSLSVYRDAGFGPSLIYYSEAGGSATTDDGTIANVDHTNGRITFINSQAGNTITAKYISRVIKFTSYYNGSVNISGAPPVPSALSLGNVGIVYNGDIVIAEGYKSKNSDSSGRARAFNFEPQDVNTKITNISVDGVNAYYITSDYYGNNWSISDGLGSWGETVFLTAPPANTVISTDWPKCVYVINESLPKFHSSILKDVPPIPTSGKYRWYDYTISGNNVNIRNKGASNIGYCYNIYPVVPEQEPVPVPPANSFVCLDPPVKSVIIDLDNITPHPKKGVIFSEVPVIVKGRAKEPILIVCLGDVYLQSINSGFSDDSDEAAPVGILSTGAVWIDHNGAYELDENHPGDSYYDVILNKVAIYTTRGFYYTGGRFWRNRFKLVGSVCNLSNDFGSFVDQTDMSAYYFTDIVKRWWVYTYSQTRGNAQLYATSFRGEKTTATSINHRPPPHMPVYIQIKYFKSSSLITTRDFINTVKTYVNDKQKIPKEVYNKLIEQL